MHEIVTLSQQEDTSVRVKNKLYAEKIRLFLHRLRSISMLMWTIWEIL